MVEDVPGGALEVDRSIGILRRLAQLLLGDDLVAEGAEEAVVAVHRVEAPGERLERPALLRVDVIDRGQVGHWIIRRGGDSRQVRIRIRCAVS